MTDPTIRLDLWLWYARFFKTRSLAAKAVKQSRMRINRRVVTKTSQPVRVGDILTFPKADEVRVIEVVAFGERRGPAARHAVFAKMSETVFQINAARKLMKDGVK